MAESKFVCETHTGESEVGFIIPKDTFWKRFYGGLINLEESMGEFDAVTYSGVRIFYRSQGDKVVVAGASCKGLNGWRHLEFPKLEIEAWELLGWIQDLCGQAGNYPPGWYRVKTALDPEKLEAGIIRFTFEPLLRMDHNRWVDSILKIREDNWM